MAMTSYLDDFNVDAETKQVLDLAFEMTPAASGPRGCASEQRDELASTEVEHGLLPGPHCFSLPQAQMPRKRPQVLGLDLNRFESTGIWPLPALLAHPVRKAAPDLGCGSPSRTNSGIAANAIRPT
jgi:hypothetical protein